MPTRQIVELGDTHNSGEAASESQRNLQSQLLDRRLTSSDIDRRINAIDALLSTQLLLIQSVRELNERSSTRSAEKNMLSDRSRISGQRSGRHNSCELQKHDHNFANPRQPLLHMLT